MIWRFIHCEMGLKSCENLSEKENRDMLALLKKRGYERASLAVQKANYAVRMYEKVGFKTMDENEEEYIMVCEL